MPAEIVARARRSSLVSTFGIGGLLPAQDDSVMICGLDEWSTGERLEEPRLAQSLGVHGFRTPSAGMRRGDVPAVRFPEWAFCPKCRRLGPGWTISRTLRTGKRVCSDCQDIAISPSRFVCCCLNGHIEDFPYRIWVHEDPRIGTDGHDLYLTARGHTSALADLLVRCSCGEQRSLEGAFEAGALRGLRRCSGARPWLPDAPAQQCDKQLRTLQRGSSNVWFAAVRSAISIPSVRARAQAFVRAKLGAARADAPAAQLAAMFDPPPGCTTEDLTAAIEEMRTPAVTQERLSETELRAEEYRALVNGLADETPEGQRHSASHFRCTPQDLSGVDLPGLIAQLCRVSRLREVRALYGFSRVQPAVTEPHLQQLSDGQPTWLPAIEVMGEGVFLRLDEQSLAEYLRSPFAKRRQAMLVDARQSSGGLMEPGDVSPRLVALHSLAHVLVDELSLTAGYPAASLRERVYAEEGQAGILIYTATADSAGSLGGLAALSDPRRFAATLESGIRRAGWCTADPVCIESTSSGVEGLNLAACHACLLLPETSCEYFNVKLDRAMLIGTQEDPQEGLFGRSYP